MQLLGKRLTFKMFSKLKLSNSETEDTFDSLFNSYFEEKKKKKARSILDKLPKTDNNISPDFVELEMPDEWRDLLLKLTLSKSVMLKETKSRTTTADRIIQPSLVSNMGYKPAAKPVKWPGIENNEKNVVVEDVYTSIEVPFKYKLLKFLGFLDLIGKPGFKDTLLENISSQLASQIDADIVSLIDEKDLSISSILNDVSVIGHPSLGFSTVAGYCETNSYENGDAWKKAYDNLPEAYRIRSKWVMNSKTAKIVAELKLSDGIPLVGADDKSKDGSNLLLTLLERPVLINDNMPDTGFVAFLADMTRGYITGKPKFNTLIIDTVNDTIAIRSKLAGQVLQPACYKVIKLIGQ